MKQLEKIKNIVSGLTDLEKICFKYFAFNYDDLETNLEDNANCICFDEVEEIPFKQLRGVMSSLIKKGLVFFADCDEYTYYISALGVCCWYYLNGELEKPTLKQLEAIGTYLN